MIEGDTIRPVQRRPLHALVIEDEPLIAMLLEDTLIEAGAESVAVAVTEEEAVASARCHRPDFITSDMHLLRGTGANAVAAIHREYGIIPVLFIASLPQSVTLFDYPVVVMSKPFRCDRIARYFVDSTSCR